MASRKTRREDDDTDDAVDATDIDDADDFDDEADEPDDADFDPEVADDVLEGAQLDDDLDEPVELPDEDDTADDELEAAPQNLPAGSEFDDDAVTVGVTDDGGDIDDATRLRDGEFICRSCYMAKRESALADPKRTLCRDCA